MNSTNQFFEEEQLLTAIYRRSLTTAEMDARRLLRKNAKALWLDIDRAIGT